MTMRMTRRELATLVGAAMLAPTAFAQTAAPLSRAIPSSGERLPAVGLGTDEIVANNELNSAESGRGGTGTGRQWRPPDRHGVVLW